VDRIQEDIRNGQEIQVVVAAEARDNVDTVAERPQCLCKPPPEQFLPVRIPTFQQHKQGLRIAGENLSEKLIELGMNLKSVCGIP